MRMFTVAIMLAGALVGSAAQAQSTRSDMTDACRQEARRQGLAGEALNDFLRRCSAGQVPLAPAAGSTTRCEDEARRQGLAGEALTDFMKRCAAGQVSVPYVVFFRHDSATLTPLAMETIKQAAAAAKASNKTRLDLVGHADRKGGDSYNVTLSLRRANAVRDALVAEGIAATAITVDGQGESRQLVATADGIGEPQNRRVEIVLQ